MNRKLGRLLEPGLDLFFIVMLVFSFAALVAGSGALALTELLAPGVLFAYYQYSKLKRRRDLEAYIQSTTNTLGNTDGGRTPFPMALVRIADGALIWANDPFMDLSGFRERMHEQKITDLMPGFQMDWLAAGKKEYPSDVRVNDRRIPAKRDRPYPLSTQNSALRTLKPAVPCNFRIKLLLYPFQNAIM